MFRKSVECIRGKAVFLGALGVLGIGMMTVPQLAQAELLTGAAENGCDITASVLEAVPGEPITLTMSAYGDKIYDDIIENSGFLGSIGNWIGDLPGTLTLLAPESTTDYTYYVWRENDETVYGGCEVTVTVIPQTYDETIHAPTCSLQIEKQSAQDLPVEEGDKLLFSWFTENASSAQLRLSPTKLFGVLDTGELATGQKVVKNWHGSEYSLEVWNENGQSATCAASVNDIRTRPVPVLQEAVYVTTSGDDSGFGSQVDPFRSVQHGIDVVAVDSLKSQVWVAEGTYSEQLVISEAAKNVSVFGGFDADNWSTQDPITHPTVIQSSRSWVLKKVSPGTGVVHGLNLLTTPPSVSVQMVAPTSTKAVYVSLTGSDLAAGTRIAPLRTIKRALYIASINALSQVWVSAGTYNERVYITSSNSGVGLYGGYDPSDWNSNDTILHETIIDSRQEWTIFVSDYHRDGNIEGFTIRTSPAAIHSNSSRAIILKNITGHLYIQNNIIEAGFGRDGTHGVAGGGGADGVVGYDGLDLAGGGGGKAGASCGYGQGGDSFLFARQPRTPSLGTGENGALGETPSSQANGEFLSTHTLDWVGLAGGDGKNGKCGKSGDGGGMGICFAPHPWGLYVFPGGGGGGGAGSGGAGARGGSGGGGSIGVLAIDSNRVWLYNNTILTKDGGEGGNGHWGGNPGIGQVGGKGGLCWGSGAGGGKGGITGQNGGRGGHSAGGAGGISAGGAGGISAGIVRIRSPDLVNPPGTDPKANVFVLGGGGFGGQGVGGAHDGIDNRNYYDYPMH